MSLSPEKKIAGVLVPLFALRGENDLGIGDLWALREFIDWAAELGFKLVQLLPINETGGDNSPYNAISATAIEPTTLTLRPGSPEDLSRDDFEAVLADVDLGKLQRGAIKYTRIKRVKRRLLECSFTRFSEQANQNRRTMFADFSKREAVWLDDYVLFRGLMEENNQSEAWDQWPADHQSVEKARAWLSGLSQEDQSRFLRHQDFFRYVQWVAHGQWQEVKSYAESHGVALMGDIPFGVSYYSADVFARPNEFALDWFGGAPPEPYFKDDEFTQKWGQNWGLPLYRWQIMRANGLQWWRRRIRGVRQAFHVFRIDHVLGFYRIYAFPWPPRENAIFLPLDWNEMCARTNGRTPHFVPRDDSTPENCEANRREGEEYLRIVLDEAGATRVVGEDLGTVPDYVRPNLRSLGIAGFKIPQWEVRQEEVIPGAEYERLSVATYATHDHKPVRALWEEAFERPTPTSQQARDDLDRIARFAGLNPAADRVNFDKDFYPAIMRALFECESWIVIIMITDLLARRYRFNVPGTTASANWARRMQRTIAQLRASRSTRARMRVIRELLQQTGRT